MPELPEVETIRRGIIPHCLGKAISQVIVRNGNLRWKVPENIGEKIVGKTVKLITRRGKYLLLHCESGALILHLGMSGFLRVVSEEAPLSKHDHVDIVFEDKRILRLNDSRRFGAVLWTENPDQHALIKHMGPEPLGALSVDDLANKGKKSSVAIKQFIMDGRVVVGVGNIYANEALFLAGIHPQTPAKNLNKEEWGRLLLAIQKTLTLAIELGGTTLKDFRDSDGKPGYFQQQLKVYGREGASCYTCASPLKSIRLGQRATVYCPKCQEK